MFSEGNTALSKITKGSKVKNKIYKYHEEKSADCTGGESSLQLKSPEILK